MMMRSHCCCCCCSHPPPSGNYTDHQHNRPRHNLPDHLLASPPTPFDGNRPRELFTDDNGRTNRGEANNPFLSFFLLLRFLAVAVVFQNYPPQPPPKEGPRISSSRARRGPQPLGLSRGISKRQKDTSVLFYYFTFAAFIHT